MHRVTYEDVKTKIKMPEVLAMYGLEVDSKGNMPCPLHGGDNKTGFGIHDQNQKWTCRTRGCGTASSNIDFVALKEGIPHSEAFIRLKDRFNMQDEEPVKTAQKPKKVAIGEPIFYEYVNERGALKYKMKRVTFSDGSKKFTPVMPNGSYSCPKEERVLYNLHNVINNDGDYIILCEGEKCADAFIDCGYIGTTFPFGCGSWSEQYLDSLKGKSVILAPDADEAGEKWLKEVSDALAGHVNSTLVVSMPDSFIVDNPSLSGHDFADYRHIKGKDEAILFITDAINNGSFIERGVDRSSLNIVTDLCRERYAEIKAGGCSGVFNLSKMLGREMDIEVMSGDVIMVIAPSGVGKTRILHHFPDVYNQLNFAVFDLELTPKILAQRYIAKHNNISFKSVPDRIAAGYDLELPTVENVMLPKRDSLTVEIIKEEVDRLEQVTGRRIDVVCIDYIAKMFRIGGATESVEAHASMFKNYCSSEGRIGIITTQRSRVSPEKKAMSDYIMPHKEDAIHSSAIEQSVQEALCFCLKGERDRDTLLCMCDKYTHGEKPYETVEIMANNLNLKYVGVYHADEGDEW